MITPRDADALAACFTTHARAVFGHAYALTQGDRALADDLVQATFEAATRAWGCLRDMPEEQRRSWLRRTVANIAVSGFRRDAAFRERLPRIEVRYRKAAADPAEAAFSAITLQRCWQIIQDLPERQHAVAVMRWQLGMKESEIGAFLGMAEKTVSATLFRVRGKLIAQLGPDHPYGGGRREGQRGEGGPS